MTTDPADLGQFLKARRAARSPEAAGLRGGGRRRTPGLRREELAALAGVSIDYLTRLEQGRHPEPSTEVLSGLAAALGLTSDGRRHLFGLVGRQDPGTVLAARDSVPGVLRRLVERVDPNPAWVLNRRRDILVWNPGAEALLGDLGARPAHERNQLHLTFRDPAARRLWVDWPLVAQDSVAQLRQVVAHAAHSSEVESLVAELCAGSPDFARLWSQQDVARACSSRRAARVDDAGDLLFETELLDAGGGDLQVVLLEPLDEQSRRRWGEHVARRAGGSRRLRSV